MDREIIIERRFFDPMDFNPLTKTNNHNLEKDPNDPEYDAVKDLDKHEIHKQTWTNKYVHLLDRQPQTLVLTERERQVMEDASKIGRLTAKRPVIFEEELDEIENRIEREISFTKGEMYFIRTDSSSPKDGTPSMPAMSSYDCVTILSTSHRAYTAFCGGCKTLYFFPWDDTMSSNLELRVFVHRRRVCAISQYDSEKVCIFNSYSDEALINLGRRIVEFCESIALKVDIESMVVDVGIQPLINSKDPPLRLIELNSFGYWMCSGASCFNWTADRDKLYGRLGKKVYFRVITALRS